MRSRRDVRELVILAGLLSFVAGLCLQPIVESDLFFRLKVGQEILARRGLVGRNLFSFTAPDYPDLDLAWLFEVAVAGLYRLGGFPAIVVGKTAAVVATFAGAFVVCRRRGAGAIASAACLAAAALMMRERFVERPHIVSFAGEVLVLAAIGRLDRPWSRTALAAFAVAMVVWANAHAGWFAGVFMLALAGAAAWPGSRVAAGRVAVLGLSALAAGLLTPVGPTGMARYLALHVTLPRLHAVDEFRVATWRSDAGFFVWLAVAVVMLVSSALVARRRRPAVDTVIDVRLLLPACGMTALGLVSVRFFADAILVMVPLIAIAASDLGRDLGQAIRHSPAAVGALSTPAGGPAPMAARLAPLLLGAFLFLAASAPRLRERAAGRPAFALGVDPGSFPTDALLFVERAGLRERMYNDFELGSYLLFEGYPRYRVFVDPRLPAYPEEMHRLLGSFDHDRATWDAAMNRYGVTSALLGYAGVNRRVAWWDPDRWALVYRAHDARVFVRRTEAWRAFIAAHEIPATFSFTVEEGAATVPLLDRPTASPVADCDWQVRLGDLLVDLDGADPRRARRHYQSALRASGCLPPDEEARVAAFVGALELAAAEWERAGEHLDRALALAPGDTRTRANRAVVLERVGRTVEAAADWVRVASESQGTPLGQAAIARARSLESR